MMRLVAVLAALACCAGRLPFQDRPAGRAELDPRDAIRRDKEFIPAAGKVFDIPPIQEAITTWPEYYKPPRTAALLTEVSPKGIEVLVQGPPGETVKGCISIYYYTPQVPSTCKPNHFDFFTEGEVEYECGKGRVDIMANDVPVGYSVHAVPYDAPPAYFWSAVTLWSEHCPDAVPPKADKKLFSRDLNGYNYLVDLVAFRSHDEPPYPFLKGWPIAGAESAQRCAGEAMYSYLGTPTEASTIGNNWRVAAPTPGYPNFCGCGADLRPGIASELFGESRDKVKEYAKELTFMCRKNARCIKAAYVCDGEVDCGDGDNSDEAFCGCAVPPKQLGLITPLYESCPVPTFIPPKTTCTAECLPGFARLPRSNLKCVPKRPGTPYDSEFEWKSYGPVCQPPPKRMDVPFFPTCVAGPYPKFGEYIGTVFGNLLTYSPRDRFHLTWLAVANSIRAQRSFATDNAMMRPIPDDEMSATWACGAAAPCYGEYCRGPRNTYSQSFASESGSNVVFAFGGEMQCDFYFPGFHPNIVPGIEYWLHAIVPYLQSSPEGQRILREAIGPTRSASGGGGGMPGAPRPADRPMQQQDGYRLFKLVQNPCNAMKLFLRIVYKLGGSPIGAIPNLDFGAKTKPMRPLSVKDDLSQLGAFAHERLHEFVRKSVEGKLNFANHTTWMNEEMRQHARPSQEKAQALHSSDEEEDLTDAEVLIVAKALEKAGAFEVHSDGRRTLKEKPEQPETEPEPDAEPEPDQPQVPQKLPITTFPLNDLYAIGIDVYGFNVQYSKVYANGRNTPPKRGWSAAATFAGKLYVYGGSDSLLEPRYTFADAWSLDISNTNLYYPVAQGGWNKLCSRCGMEGHTGHGMAAGADGLFIFGGFWGGYLTSNVWLLPTSGSRKTRLYPLCTPMRPCGNKGPSPRFGAAVTLSGDILFVYGGVRFERPSDMKPRPPPRPRPDMEPDMEPGTEPESQPRMMKDDDGKKEKPWPKDAAEPEPEPEPLPGRGKPVPVVMYDLWVLDLGSMRWIEICGSEQRCPYQPKPVQGMGLLRGLFESGAKNALRPVGRGTVFVTHAGYAEPVSGQLCDGGEECYRNVFKGVPYGATLKPVSVMPGFAATEVPSDTYLKLKFDEKVYLSDGFDCESDGEVPYNPSRCLYIRVRDITMDPSKLHDFDCNDDKVSCLLVGEYAKKPAVKVVYHGHLVVADLSAVIKDKRVYAVHIDYGAIRGEGGVQTFGKIPLIFATVGAPGLEETPLFRWVLTGGLDQWNQDSFCRALNKILPGLRCEQLVVTSARTASIIIDWKLINLAPGTAAVVMSLLRNAISSGAMNDALLAENLGLLIIDLTPESFDGAEMFGNFDVTNSPSECDAETTITMTAMTTANGFLGSNSHLRVLVPSDIAIAGVTSVTLSSGTQSFIVSGPSLAVNAQFGTFVMFLDAIPFSIGPMQPFEVKFSGAIMPSTCLTFNNWFWALVSTSGGSFTNWAAGNPPSDECHGRTVVIFGDPHFISFSGGSFEVTGSAGHIYNVISDTHFTWNSRFINGRGYGRFDTYLGESGFLVNGTKVVVKPGDLQKEASIYIANKQVTAVNERVYLPGDKWYVKQFDNVILLRVPGFRIALKRVLKAHGKIVPHFDHTVQRTEEQLQSPHGILGQTARLKAPVKPTDKDGGGVIQGSVEDYEVSSLLSTKFTFNQYQGQ